MEQVSRWSYLKRRRLLVVERAEAFQAAAARALELQVLPDDLVDLRPLTDQRDVRGPDPSPSRHQLLPPMTAALVAADTAAVLRRLMTSSSHSRNTCWWSVSSSSASKVGRGDQPPVDPLWAICRSPLRYRWVPFHIDVPTTSTGLPSRCAVQVPLQKDL